MRKETWIGWLRLCFDMFRVAIYIISQNTQLSTPKSVDELERVGMSTTAVGVEICY